MLLQKDIDRFWSKIKFPNDLNDCWLFNSFHDKDGYVFFWWNNKRIASHRFSYIIHHQNETISDLLVCHSCDNPSCVNPKHLFVGDAIDNMIDRDAKNRNIKGQQVNTSIVTEEKLYNLIENINNKNITTIKDAATFLQIKEQETLKIINGKSWLHFTQTIPNFFDIAESIKRPTSGFRAANRRFTDQDIFVIRDLLKQGKSVQTIATQFKVHYNIISDIKLRKTYNYL